MKAIDELTLKANFSGQVIVHAGDLMRFAVMWGIESTLTTSILLTSTTLFFTILILTADLIVSLLVLACVVLTVLDVMGFMYFMDIYLDITSMVLLCAGQGLTIDYAVHIIHHFLNVSPVGTKIVVHPAEASAEPQQHPNITRQPIQLSHEERMRKTLVEMGPPVFNGGLSTILSFSPLFLAKSTVLLTFFKLFALVIAFSLYHGLVVIPVVLVLVAPYLPLRGNAVAPLQPATEREDSSSGVVPDFNPAANSNAATSSVAE